MAQISIQIRLPIQQLALIDAKVEQNIFRSRSEAVREYIRRQELLELIREFQTISEQGGVRRRAVLNNLERLRGQLYRGYL